MWTEWVSVVIPPRPSTAYRNGTTAPSAYDELLPLRSPFCQLHGVVSFAHWSRLTLRPPADGAALAEPPRPTKPENAKPATTNVASSTSRKGARRIRSPPSPQIPSYGELFRTLRKKSSAEHDK